MTDPIRGRINFCLWMVLGACMVTPVLGQENFLNLPLEDLLKIEISSASRKKQLVQEVAAAVFVISREDIERSGARSIPEALRLAPGVEVARIANNRWAVSIRGFNGRFANKLLVLKDGRSVYSPLFSGVFWEAEDAILSDIERIEVIRGPGAAMWGSNAVNGVINIISRNAADTQGTEVIASTATDEPGSVTLRHGFVVGDAHWRVSAKGFDLSPAKTASGSDGNDGWTSGRFGMRGDWSGAEGGRWTLVGETYRSRADERRDLTRFNTVPPLIDIQQLNTGSIMSLRREQAMDDGGALDWQLSAETTSLNSEFLIHEDRQTFSGEVQRRLPLGRHDLIVGGSYRHSSDSIQILNANYANSMAQPQKDWRIASVFAHDEYELLPNRLRLSGGIRLDHDNWTGTQVQPNVRMAWTPDSDTTWWSSLARAARTPSRFELDIPYSLGETSAVAPSVSNPFGAPAIQTLRVPPSAGTLQAEEVTTFELGFRQRINSQLSLDLVAFVSDYSHLVSFATQTYAVTYPVTFVPVTNGNEATARTQGIELAADWQVSPHWRIQPSYSLLYLSSPRLTDPVEVTVQEWWEGRVPRHRASLRSSWTLGEGRQFDLWLKYTSSLSNPQVPAYTVLDLRYAFRIGKQAEIAIIGQNLLDERHPEFVSDYLPVQQTEIGRSLLIKGTWRF